jgi:hypothetical protein
LFEYGVMSGPERNARRGGAWRLPSPGSDRRELQRRRTCKCGVIARACGTLRLPDALSSQPQVSLPVPGATEPRQRVATRQAGFLFGTLSTTRSLEKGRYQSRWHVFRRVDDLPRRTRPPPRTAVNIFSGPKVVGHADGPLENAKGSQAL